MSVGNSSHGSETIVLRFTIVYLTTTILNRLLSVLKPLSNK